MKKRELFQFRLAARVAAARALREGKITRLERGQFLLKLQDAETAEEMADMCLAKCVECKIVSPKRAEKGNVKWGRVGEKIDWVECMATFLPMILAFI